MSSPLKIRTQPTQPVARPAGRGDLLSLPLIDALVQAARGDDRARFDKCFDECFEQLYAHAFRTTHDQKEAEALTEQILFDVVRGR